MSCYFLSCCLFVFFHFVFLFFLSRHHADQMSEWPQVARVTPWVRILKCHSFLFETFFFICSVKKCFSIFPLRYVYICSYIPAILVTVVLPDYILIGENKSWWWHIFRTECKKTLFWLSLLKWGHEFHLKSVIYTVGLFSYQDIYPALYTKSLPYFQLISWF